MFLALSLMLSLSKGEPVRSMSQSDTKSAACQAWSRRDPMAPHPEPVEG